MCLAAAGTLVDGSSVILDPAHTVGREHDEIEVGPRGGEIRAVKREAVVPLCRGCHTQYDEHRLDLLPYLFRPEEEWATHVLGIAGAYGRLTGRRG